MMNAIRILSGLERSTATGHEAEGVARMGFLEWAFSEEGDVTAAKARRALECPEARQAYSDAARAFVDYLEQAARPVTSGGTRRRRHRIQ